jgi:hypothetical protein
MHMFAAPGPMGGNPLPRGGHHRAAGHGGGRVAAPSVAPSAAATAAAAASTTATVGMPAPVALYGAAPVAVAGPSAEVAAVPAPIMVFNSPPHQAHKLAAAIEHLQLESSAAANALRGEELQGSSQSAAAAAELPEPVAA